MKTQSRTIEPAHREAAERELIAARAELSSRARPGRAAGSGCLSPRSPTTRPADRGNVRGGIGGRFAALRSLHVMPPRRRRLGKGTTSALKRREGRLRGEHRTRRARAGRLGPRREWRNW